MTALKLTSSDSCWLWSDFRTLNPILIFIRSCLDKNYRQLRVLVPNKFFFIF